MTNNTRIPVFDNARALLCLLVVTGHALQPLVIAHDDSARIIYETLYAFHIPAFVAISGSLSRSQEPLAGTVRLLWPLLVFQALYTTCDLTVLHRPWDWAYLTQPYWMLWFLLSLFFWRSSLPVLLRMPHPLLLTTLLALAVGVIPEVGYFLSLSRTFVFWPFFLAGHLYLRGTPTASYTRRTLAVVAFGMTIAFFYYYPLDYRLQFGSFGYAAMGMSPLLGICERAAQLLAGAVLATCFFYICPTGNTLWTERGQSPLAPYLLHGFILLGATALGLYDRLEGATSTLVVVIASAGLYFLVSSRIAVRATHPLWGAAALFGRRQRAAA